jgi:hypothetical protein
VSDADAGAHCKQAHDLGRSRLDLPTKKVPTRDIEEGMSAWLEKELGTLARGRFQKEKQTRIYGGRDRDRTCDPYHVNGGAS